MSMERNRSKHRIIYDILIIIRKNNNQMRYTPLLRQTNISSSNFAKYYKELLEKEFVTEVIEDKTKKTVYLAEKGLKYIEKYKTFMEILKEFDL